MIAAQATSPLFSHLDAGDSAVRLVATPEEAVALFSAEPAEGLLLHFEERVGALLTALPAELAERVILIADQGTSIHGIERLPPVGA